MRKRWYFILRKESGKSSVEMFMYLKGNKFKVNHYLHSGYLMNWWQAHWYWLCFNLPLWVNRKANAAMFGYKTTTGTVHLRRLEDEMLS